MGLSSDGLVLARGVNRLPADQRWVTEGRTELKGLPWDVRPRVRRSAKLPLDDKEPLQRIEDPKALREHEYHGPKEGKAFFHHKNYQSRTNFSIVYIIYVFKKSKQNRTAN